MYEQISIEYYEEISKHIYFDDKYPRWNLSRRRVKKGQIAGQLKGSGRILRFRIGDTQKIISAHRLLWFMYYKEYPPKIIFHIDRDKDNNSVKNLIGLDPRSDFNGVRWDIKRDQWCAIAYLDDDSKFLGYFETEKDAAKSWDSAIDGIYPNYKKNFNYDLLKKSKSWS